MASQLLPTFKQFLALYDERTSRGGVDSSVALNINGEATETFHSKEVRSVGKPPSMIFLIKER